MLAEAGNSQGRTVTGAHPGASSTEKCPTPVVWCLLKRCMMLIEAVSSLQEGAHDIDTTLEILGMGSLKRVIGSKNEDIEHDD